jgi:hypothetical protein
MSRAFEHYTLSRLFISFYVFYDMTLAGLDDTHTTGWDGMGWMAVI